MYIEKKLLNDLLQKLVKMYKCTIGNDLKENPKSSFQFNLISCIYKIFVNIEKQVSRFFIVITVLRKWAFYQILGAKAVRLRVSMLSL